MADVRTQVAAMLPPNMNEEQVDAIVHHIVNIWWPQLCASSRTLLVANHGLFDKVWYDENHLLDIHNPAYGIIVKALGKSYAHILVRYPEQDANSFRARWSLDHEHGEIHVRLDGPKDAAGHSKCFRVAAPACGWLNFQAEIDGMRTKRDAKCAYLNGKPTVVGGRAPSNSFNVPDTGIPSDHGALAVTPDKKKAIAEDMADAMIDNPVSGPLFHSALSTMPEEQQTIDKVSKWIANAETTTEQNDKSATEQNDKSTIGGASTTHFTTPNVAPKPHDKPATDPDDNHSTTSTDKRFKSYDLVDLLPEEEDDLNDWIHIGASASDNEQVDPLSEKKDEWDDWVDVEGAGPDDEETKDIVEYKKEDATPAVRKGWVTALLWKKV